MTTAKAIHILDLPIEVVESIERAVGARMSEWPEGVDSLADLYSRVYAAGSDTPLEDVKAMTLRELTAAVNFGDEDDSDPT